MKTKTTIKHILLALTVMVSVTACKKDKKSDPAPPPPVNAITLTALKALSTGASVRVSDNTKISGVVISDVSNKNIDPKTVILQDPASQTGIIIIFDAAQTFALGDQVEVNISNQTLAQVNGEIELTNVAAANAKKTGTGTITAKAATAADITTNKAAWDGTLVSIASADLALTGGNGKYSGTLTIANSTGTLTSNVLAGASFENTAYPVSVSSITGIVRTSGNDIRIDIRKPADVVTGTVTRLVTEDWTNLALNTPFDKRVTWDLYDAGPWTTAAGAWNSGAQAYFFPGSQFDADFTAAGKSYVYMIEQQPPFPTSSIYGTLSNNFTNLAGLKQVSVTFAGSKMNGDKLFTPFTNTTYTGANKVLWYSVLPFDASKDYFQIAIVPYYINSVLINPTNSANPAAAALAYLTSAKYTQTGKFSTVTWTLPTKDQLVAAGVSSSDADNWLTNPTFAIVNLSTRTTLTLDNTNHIAGGVYAPILIDKVVLGF